MSIALIQQRLAAYGYTSTLEEDRAIREITQEVVLAALARFSEDLDFALQAPDAAF